MTSKNNKNSYGVLKTQKQYLKLLFANAVNRFGDSIDSVAYSLMMYAVTGSASLMALVLAVNYLPTVLLQPIAGAMVDRMNKQRVMVLCDIGRGAVVALTAAAYVTGTIGTAVIMLSVVLNSTLEALRVPAGVAVQPALLDEDKYLVGLALGGTVSRVCEIAGLALAGGTVALLGVEGALLIDASTFLISALAIAWIKNEKIRLHAAQGGINLRGTLASLADGFRYVRGNRSLAALILFGVILNFSAVPLNTFFTPYITDDVGGGAWMLSAVQLAMVAGTGLGAFLTPKLGAVSTRAQIFAAGIVNGGVYIAMYFVPFGGSLLLRCGFLLGIIILMGVAGGVLNVQFGVGFMRAVDDEYRGRIAGITNSLLTCTMPLCSLLMSGLVRLLTVPETLLAAGVMSLAMFAAVWFVPLFKSLGGDKVGEDIDDGGTERQGDADPAEEN